MTQIVEKVFIKKVEIQNVSKLLKPSNLCILTELLLWFMSWTLGTAQVVTFIKFRIDFFFFGGGEEILFLFSVGGESYFKGDGGLAPMAGAFSVAGGLGERQHLP